MVKSSEKKVQGKKPLLESDELDIRESRKRHRKSKI